MVTQKHNSAKLTTNFPMAAPKKKDADIIKEREEAWIGDAVLNIYVREYILDKFGVLDGEMFIRFTSNDFLRCHGNPTSVEAEIGRTYSAEGLEAAFQWIETHLLPKFLIQEKNYQRMLATRVSRKSRKK